MGVEENDSCENPDAVWEGYIKQKSRLYKRTTAYIIVPRLVICKMKVSISADLFFGAEDEARTRDPNLGKVVLYQLSYFRVCFP